MLNCEQSEILMSKQEVCTHAEILMLKHMEKTLTAEDAAKLVRHVQDCQSCREYYIAFDEAMEIMDDFAVSGTELDTVPEYFTANVMAGVRSMPAYVAPEVVTARKTGRIALYVFWGVSAALVALALFLAYNPQYLINLAYAYPVFEGAVAALERIMAAFGQVPDRLMADTTVMEQSFGIAALGFVLLLGMLLVVLHKDESKTSATA